MLMRLFPQGSNIYENPNNFKSQNTNIKKKTHKNETVSLLLFPFSLKQE